MEKIAKKIFNTILHSGRDADLENLDLEAKPSNGRHKGDDADHPAVKKDADAAEAQEKKKPEEAHGKREAIISSLADKGKGVKAMMDYVIDDDEKTIKNFVNPVFWLKKQRYVKDIMEKAKTGKNVYDVLSEGAKPSWEYYILTILSCIIASAGLIQGSTATIIGAMIVAPLMTPILAFSLGVIRGDLHLIRVSFSSILKGVFWAIIISAVLSYVVPIPSYSGEILSRAKPTLFDVIVALASGLVGAYGYANEKISSSLVGIAIAVALMPPLCTVGIGLGTLNLSMASGAAVLFAINLISISLAGAIVFWILRVHPPLTDKNGVMKRAMYQIVISVAILAAICIPLGFFMYDRYKRVEAKEFVSLTFQKDFPQYDVLNLEATEKGSSYSLRLTLTGSESPDQAQVKKIHDEIVHGHPMITELKIVFLKSSAVVR